MSAQGVKSLPALAVCGVDVAVSGPCADQDGPPTLGALHEGQVPDGAVMHAELQVRPFDQKTPVRPVQTARPVEAERPWRTRGVASVGAERQDFDKFIIGAGGQQLPAVAPGHAVDGALVVFVPPEADGWRFDGAGSAA